MSKGKFAVGTIIGAVAGLIAGILTAPKSGKETRADLKVKADELKDTAAKKTDEIREVAAKKTDALIDKTSDVVTDVKVATNDFKKRTENAIEGAKEGFNTKK